MLTIILNPNTNPKTDPIPKPNLNLKPCHSWCNSYVISTSLYVSVVSPLCICSSAMQKYYKLSDGLYINVVYPVPDPSHGDPIRADGSQVSVSPLPAVRMDDGYFLPYRIVLI